MSDTPEVEVNVTPEAAQEAPAADVTVNADEAEVNVDATPAAEPAEDATEG